MKKKIRILNKLLIFSIIFMLFSCSEDLFDEEINQNKKIIAKKISMQDAQFKNNAKLVKSIADLKNIQLNRYSSRFDYSEVYDFYIDEENGVYLEKERLESYTFPVYKMETDSMVTNIVFNKNLSGEYDVILGEYDILKSDFIDITAEELAQSAVVYTDITGRFRGPELICIETQEYVMVPIDQGDLTGNFGYVGIWVTIGSYCYWSDTGGGGSDIGNSSGGGILTGPIDSSHGGGGGDENLTPPNPCNNLKKLFDPVKANIKPKIITDLQPNIAVNPSGEKGVSLAMNSSGVPTNTIIPPVIQPPLPIPTGVNYYSAIHTHPLDTYPMFSWSDVVVLNNLNNHSASHNQGLASFLLVCQDDNGVFQTYAVVFDPNSLNDTIDQFMGNPENVGCSSQEIELEMNKKLGEEYLKDSNYERAFLKFMSSSNVSLYRANSTLTNWSKLTLSNNSATATVNSTNCN